MPLPVVVLELPDQDWLNTQIPSCGLRMIGTEWGALSRNGQPVGVAAWDPGLEWPETVDQLDKQVDSQMDAANAAITTCPAFPPDLRAAWIGDWNAWKIIHNGWTSSVVEFGWHDILSPVGVINQVLLDQLAGSLNKPVRAMLTSVYANMVEYAKKLTDPKTGWQVLVHQYCPTFVIPPGPVIPNPPTPPAGDWLDKLKTAGEVVGVTVLVVGGAYVIYRIVK